MRRVALGVVLSAGLMGAPPALGQVGPSAFLQPLAVQEAAPWRPDPLTRARALRLGARPSPRTTASLTAGAAALPITPTAYEIYEDANDDATFQPEVDTFFDTGTDRLWDWEEPGALGPDGQPGRAAWDDDFDGQVDETDEYLGLPSDDLADPSQDNFDRQTNPGGTEGNAEFDAVVLAGFQGLLGQDIRPALGVHDEIWSRAVAVSQGETHVLFITNDVVGMLFQFMNPVKRALEADLGIPFENIVISSTHTHQGPDTVGIWGGPVDPVYMAFVMDQMYAAGVQAWLQREPVSARSTTVRPRACYDKATLVMKDGSACDESDYVPDNFDSASPFDQPITQNDLRDPWVRRMEIPIQQLLGADGTVVASLISFDTHPELLLDENQLISSDYPHFTREVLEERFGGVALFLTGSVGCQMGALRGTPIPLWDEAGRPVYQPGVTDVNGQPVPAWAQGTEARTRSEGMEIGNAAADAIARTSLSASPTLSVQTSWIDVVVTNPVFRLIIHYIALQDSFEEAEYVIRAPYCTHVGCIRTPVSRVTIGDATYVTVPGEFPPEYLVGRDASTAPYSEDSGGEWEDWTFDAMPSLADASPSRDLFLVGLANNYFGYAMNESDYLGFMNTEHPNYYEEVYTTDKCFGDAVGNRLFELMGSSVRVNPSCPAHP